MPEIRSAGAGDVPLILSFIEELAEYERLAHEVVATEELLRDSLFGERPVTEVVIADEGDESRRGSPSFSTPSRPFWGDPASTWRIST